MDMEMEGYTLVKTADLQRVMTEIADLRTAINGLTAAWPGAVHYCTVEETASALVLSPETVRRYCREGRFPHASQNTPGGPWKVPPADIAAFNAPPLPAGEPSPTGFSRSAGPDNPGPAPLVSPPCSARNPAPWPDTAPVPGPAASPPPPDHSSRHPAISQTGRSF